MYSIGINFLTSETRKIMKRFLIDTYRIFLLQTSKVLWDIIGWTFLIWYVFYATYGDNGFNQLIFYSTFAGIWLGIRLFYTRGRRKLEEVEMLRPATPLAKGISNILVLFLFFVLICGVTSFLYYDYKLARFVLWFQDYFNTGANLSKEPYYKYINLINEITPEILEGQKEIITASIAFFWYCSIPAAVVAKLKLIPRIIFISLLTIGFFFIFKDISSFVNKNNEDVFYIIFYLIYLLMFIYLIIPRRTNFK